jgi:signal transduction histidine kinase
VRLRTWPFALLGLGGLLLLIVISVHSASRQAQDIYSRLDELSTHHREIESIVHRLRSDVQLSAIFIRDYLLDADAGKEADYRRRLESFHSTSRVALQELGALLGHIDRHQRRLASLRIKLDEYWRVYEPLFAWNPSQDLERSAAFLQTKVMPAREAVLAITGEIEELNDATLATERARVAGAQVALRSDLRDLLWRTLALGLVVAFVAVFRLRAFERRSDEQRVAAQRAEQEMRALAQQVVAAQEQERKHLSRELHDHIGQMLTALRLQLGRIERLRNPADPRVLEVTADGRVIVDAMVGTVRDLALGLRPSMLDDFGLQAALEWHVRDFTRRCSVPVELTIAGNVDQLPDQHRTCVYRTVQEALTNCARHAKASRIDVTIHDDRNDLVIGIADDGLGIDSSRSKNGLGLRGIEERVRDLGGTMTLAGGAGGGTTLTIRFPRPAATSEVPLARAAG